MENETPLDTEPCWLDRDTHQFTIENRVCRVFNGGPQRFQPHTAGIETCPLPLCPWLSSSCKAGGLQRSIALRKFIFKEFSSQSQHGSFLFPSFPLIFFFFSYPPLSHLPTSLIWCLLGHCGNPASTGKTKHLHLLTYFLSPVYHDNSDNNDNIDAG